MVRRVATQVHKQVARLLRSKYLQTEPAWYQAVLAHPPIPLPPRAPPNRSNFDLPKARSQQEKLPHKTSKPKALPIVYLEDEVRRQFFRDHPFEAFRERSIVETGLIEEDHPIRGKAWTMLSQRGRNPLPEDAMLFAVNLHLHHDKSVSDAYMVAVTQFRSLRSEQHIATVAAVAEAEAYGATFGPTETQKAFDREEEYLKSWEDRPATAQESNEARKRWKMIVERTGNEGSWTRGEEYLRLWKEGVRPNYAPSLSAPVEEEVPLYAQTDFMQLQKAMQK